MLTSVLFQPITHQPCFEGAERERERVGNPSVSCKSLSLKVCITKKVPIVHMTLMLAKDEISTKQKKDELLNKWP